MVAIRLITFGLAAFIWIAVLPIWLVMLIREVSVSAISSVASVFGSSSNTNNTDRLDTVAKFWIKGFSDLYQTLVAEKTSDGTLKDVGYGRLFMETIMAVLFYSTFIWWPKFLDSFKIFFDENLGKQYKVLTHFFDQYMPAWMAAFFPLILAIIFIALLFRFFAGPRKRK